MYDELLDAVRARVTRFVNSADAPDVLDPAGLRDAAALLEVAGRGQRRAAVHAVALLRYARAMALLSRDRAAADAESEVAVPLLNEVVEHIPELPGQVDALSALSERATDRVGDPPDVAFVDPLGPDTLGAVDRVIALVRRRLRSGVEEDDRPLRMHLATAQERRFQRVAALVETAASPPAAADPLAELDASVATVRSVLADTAPDHPQYANRLSQLGQRLQQRALLRADLSELDAAVAALRDALAACPVSHEDRPMHLANLGRGLLLRFQARGAGPPADPADPARPADPANPADRADPADLDEARDALDRSVSGRGRADPFVAGRFEALAQVYATRLAAFGDDADLSRAVDAMTDAVSMSQPGDPGLPERLIALGSLHLARYEARGDPADRGTAADLAQRVRAGLPRRHPLRAAADALHRRCRAARAR
jgi:hypothetical protein